VSVMDSPAWFGAQRFWVFDLDDTLFPEKLFVMGGFRAVAERVVREHGVDISTVLARNFERGLRHDAFRVAVEGFGIAVDEPYAKELVTTYREHRPKLVPFDDAPPLIEALSSQAGCPIGIVTDGLADVQRRKLAALPLCEAARSVVVTDELGGRSAWKPNPVGLTTCLQQLLCTDPSLAVYVADNPEKDFLAAHRAGMHAIRIARPGTEHGAAEVDDIAKAPDLTFSSLTGLLTALGLGG
jgi:putative hydrolase of the HAD superfamily